MKISLAILTSLILCGCGHETKSPAGLSGDWDLRVGITTAALTLKDDNGVLTGQVKFTPEFGGLKTEVHGLRAADKVQFEYTEAKETNFFSYEGTIDGIKLSGSYSVSGHVNGQGIVWTAIRH